MCDEIFLVRMDLRCVLVSARPIALTCTYNDIMHNHTTYTTSPTKFEHFVSCVIVNDSKCFFLIGISLYSSHRLIEVKIVNQLLIYWITYEIYFRMQFILSSGCTTSNILSRAVYVYYEWNIFILYELCMTHLLYLNTWFGNELTSVDSSISWL